jgi:uncharacterized membrane protein HdeD (DUF308 family)
MNILQLSRGWLIFEGFAFLLLGILAIILPGIMTLGVELFIGWLLLLGGLVKGFRTFQTYHTPGFWSSLATSLIAIIVGMLMLAYPLNGIITLTILLTAYFFIEGIAKIVWAVRLHPIKGWVWLLISGLIAIAMGAIIVSGWPSTALWVIGLLVGIDMLFFGSTLLGLAFQHHDEENRFKNV